MKYMHAGQKPISRGDIEEYGGQPITACADCGKDLQLGDYVDHYFPYYSTHNQCRECAEENNFKKEGGAGDAK